MAIIQARLGSSRLPGKVLAPLAGRPMLVHVIERARAIVGIHELVVATTPDPRDASVLSIAREQGVAAFTGSADDVLDRYYRAAREHAADAVLRITADCPLLDPLVSGAVLARLEQGDVDYVSNVHPPTFPDGLDTEAFSFDALERAWREADRPSEREHVTPYIWGRGEGFRRANVAAPDDLSLLRWTVDEPADLDFVGEVLARLPRGVHGYRATLAVVSKEPRLSSANRDIPRNAGYARSVREERTR